VASFITTMNSFNKTEAAVFSCRLCFLRAFPFISLNYVVNFWHTYYDNFKIILNIKIYIKLIYIYMYMYNMLCIIIDAI